MGENRTIISFKVNEENFAFDALKVRHILEYGDQTKVPNTPDYMLGVINLHGNIIPIADLRKIIGNENPVNTQDTSIVVLSPDDQLHSYIGFVVDIVNEVFQVSEGDIKPSIIENNIGMVNSLDGTIKIEEEFVNIINLDDLVEKIEEAK